VSANRLVAIFGILLAVAYTVGAVLFMLADRHGLAAWWSFLALWSVALAAAWWRREGGAS